MTGANALSMFGRLSYGAHLILYPVVGGTSFFLYSTKKVRDDKLAITTYSEFVNEGHL